MNSSWIGISQFRNLRPIFLGAALLSLSGCSLFFETVPVEKPKPTASTADKASADPKAASSATPLDPNQANASVLVASIDAPAAFPPAVMDELKALISAWNTARNKADTVAVASLFRPEEQKGVLSNPIAKPGDALIQVENIEKLNETIARITYKRSSGAQKQGQQKRSILAVLLNGKWLLAERMPQQAPAVQAAKGGPMPPRTDGQTQSLAPPDIPQTISAGVGRVTLLKLPFPIRRIAVGDPRIVDFSMVTSTELYLLGKSVGTTNLILWDTKGATHHMDAQVSIDLSALRDSLKNTLPREHDIQVSSSSGSVVLSGSVSDSIAAEATANLADAYILNLNRYLRGAAAGGAAQPAAQTASTFRVINLLKIRDPQQVMLSVRIAEVSKDLLDKFGMDYTFGSNPMALIKSFNPAAGLASPSLVYLLTGKRGGTLNVNAQKEDGLVKILAEPTIVAMSGKEGSFLSGGQVYIPVPTVSGSSPTLQQTEFGIRLKFLPTVLDGGRISLQVAPEVSEPISVGTNNEIGFSVRKVSSTVEMRDGETLVIGGLIKNNLSESIKAFPILGEIPILGLLFRSTEFQEKKTELLVVVSPTLVKARAETPALPTDSFTPPSRSQLFFGGRLEGDIPAQGR